MILKDLEFSHNYILPRLEKIKIGTRKRAALIFAGAEDVDLAIKQAAERFKQNAIARGFKMTEYISDERIALILDNTAKDYVNLDTFNKWRDFIVGDKEVEELSQEDRQRLVEAYNKYRAAPYDWYEREESK